MRYFTEYGQIFNGLTTEDQGSILCVLLQYVYDNLVPLNGTAEKPGMACMGLRGQENDMILKLLKPIMSLNIWMTNDKQ